jgi:hypothetical protein
LVPDRTLSVHKTFAKWQWRRRIVALAAAYALALSALIGTFGAAREAAAAPTIPGLITCHTDAAGAPPPDGGTNGKLCTDSCCIGCLMLMADLPPPPAVAAGHPQSSLRKLALPPAFSFTGTRQARSHQSRGPPYAA